MGMYFVDGNKIPENYQGNHNAVLFSLNPEREGQLFEDGQFDTFLNATNQVVLDRLNSPFQGVTETVLGYRDEVPRAPVHPTDTVDPTTEVAMIQPVATAPPTEGLAEQPRRSPRRVFKGIPAYPEANVTVGPWNDSQQKADFKKLVGNILGPVINGPINLLNPHGLPHEKQGNSFDVALWSQIPSSKKDLSPIPDKIFGINCQSTDPTYKPSGHGIMEIADPDTGYVVAELFADKLFIHFDISHFGTEDELWIFRKILEATIDILSDPDLQSRAREAEEEKRRRSFVNICMKSVTAKVRDAEQTLNNTNNDITNYQENLTVSLRKREALMKEIPFLKGDHGDLEEKFYANYKALLEYDNVLDVIADNNNNVTVYTDMLNCIDPRTNLKHEIGKFKIVINANGRDGFVRWFNLSRSVHGYNERMQAPHVFQDGKPCLGSLEGILPQYLAKWDFATIITLATKFVESCNVDDPAGEKVDRWPFAEESYGAATAAGHNIDEHKSRWHQPTNN